MPHFRAANMLKPPALTIGLAIAIILTFVGLPLLITYKAPVTHAITMATSHEPEKFSELYFENSALLPLYAPANIPQRVAFRISNHESQTITYHYIATMSTGLATSQIAEGEITLDDTASGSVPISFVMPVPNGSAQISVQLVGRSEHIAFRVKS
ncbi:MAG TPA: hypothetical protein VLH86_02000 [Patescibacteria group bacterium]|nr:hypothetical protein [Patescibacteria group bacterium]